MSGQGKNGQDESTNGRVGYSGKSFFLLFVGGALAGAAVAYLAQRKNRARVGELAEQAREMAALLPLAVRAARAAKEAFAETYSEGEPEPKRKRHAG